MGLPSKKYIYDHPELNQDPNGFDCSGFARYVLQQSGLLIPDYIGLDTKRRPIRHANEFWDSYGMHVHEELVTGGDLVLFSRSGDFVTHIGIMVSNNHYIHSPGIDNKSIEIQPIIHKPIVYNGDKKQLYIKNPVGFKTPVLSPEDKSYRYERRPLP